jgi:hypothetical protein
MKKLISIILLVVSIGTLIGCNSDKEQNSNKLKKSIYDASQQNTDVIFSVKEESVTPTTDSITLIYNNTSNKEYTYGKELHLEVKVNDVWYVVRTLENIAWEDIGYLLPPNQTKEGKFSLISNYGILNTGNYRIIKTLYSNGEKILSIAEFKMQ